MAVLAGVNAPPKTTGKGIVAAIFLFVLNSFFDVGWLGMTWLYPAEVSWLKSDLNQNT